MLFVELRNDRIGFVVEIKQEFVSRHTVTIDLKAPIPKQRQDRIHIDLKCTLPLFRVDEPSFLIDLVARESEQYR